MNRPLRALLVEDTPDDAELVLRALRSGGYDVEWERVEDPEAMAAALERTNWDIVISDHTLPRFSAPAALRLLQERELDIPFLVVSGSIGEEQAVDVMRSGARDFMIKGRLVRLAAAVEREVHEAGIRRARRMAEARQRSAEAELADLACRDRLTGLPNRLGFEHDLELAVGDSVASGGTLAVLRVQLDRLPEIENTVGHAASEALVQEIAQRLAASGAGSLSRLTDSEFALLLPGADSERAIAIAHAIGVAFEDPPRAGGLPIMVEPTLGISVFPAHGRSSAALLRAAAVAASSAHKQGTRWATYSADRDPYDPRSLELLAHLGEALETGHELQLHYQPAVDLRTRRVIGVEALLRWRSARFGPVPPDQFIPLAERTGLVRPLSRWVLNEAFRQAHEWRADDVELSVGVNLSARNLYEPDVVERIRGLRETWGVPWSALEVEITESALIDDPRRAREVLTRLHEHGLKLAIDDFGTGYSSLTHLRDLPFSKVKIDKSFVLGVTASAENTAFVRAIVDLGHALGMQVQAEGVETAEVLELLAEVGCDLAQGYHIGRPMPDKDLRAWLAESSWGRREPADED